MMRPSTRRLAFFLFLAALVAVLVGIYIASKGSKGLPSSPAPVRSSETLQREWLAGVQTVLATYDQDHDAQKAENALLTLVVPTKDERQLNLVLAFQALVNGKKNADQMLATARAAFET